MRTHTLFAHMHNWGVACSNKINLVSHQAIMDTDYLAGLLCSKMFFVYLIF